MTTTGSRPPLGPSRDDPFALWDGAYVLGALSADEHRRYGAHLSGCASCRAAVSEIDDLPHMLELLSADEVIALDENTAEPPPLRPHVLDSLVDDVASRRRRSRWLMTAVAVAAAVLLAVGLLIVARPSMIGLQREQPAPPAVAMEQVVPSPVHASFVLTSFGWGTRIDMTCTYGSYADRDKEPGKFVMVLVGRDGTRNQAASWQAQPNSSVTVDASTSTPADQIAAVQVVEVKTGDVLLQQNL